jgi:iron complex transport system substrate-binding protein
MIMRQIFFFFLILFMDTAAHAGATVSYTDRLNRTVDIPVPVQRVVFLQMYELLPAMDVWDKVVGVASYVYGVDIIRQVKPDIEGYPSVGSGANVNIEAVMQLKPDLVITWAWDPAPIRFMEAKGIRVIAVYPASIGELFSVMQLMGQVFQREETLKTVMDEMNSIFSMIRERAGKRVEKEKRTMLYLGGKSNSVSCALGINHEIMTMIGGVNLAGSIQQQSTEVSLEQLVIWNPEVIFIWPSAGYTEQDILNNPQWRHIRAVRDGRVYKLPKESTWSPRLALAALWMAKKAYPEEYRDIDYAAMADGFYRKLFHIPYQPKATP